MAEGLDGPFLMVVEDVFRAGPHGGRNVWVTGRVERGRVRAGDEVEIVGLGAAAGAVPVLAVETGRLPVAEAGAGTNAGMLLPGSVADALERGQVLAEPGTVGAHRRFLADLALLAAEQGGVELRGGERLLVHLGAAAVTGTVTLPKGAEVLRPLHQGAVVVTLERPVPLEPGRRFAVRHAGRAVGAGTVTGLPR
ncbi:EF-Tu/IF-2/RF-3 family GTPase [Streptomyces albidoflavus]|uniref:EF-Tu/IF-2/RF-3 family GTPase n=1 Tax=Streptomyces albidoflavus TaxID=1886 RepID=UPI0033AD1840